MTWWSVEPRTRKYVKGYGFLSFIRKYKKAINWCKTRYFQKVVYKASEFLGNRIADTVAKANNDRIEEQQPVEEIIIPTEKREEILNKSILKMEHYKISKLLNDSIVPRFVTKRSIKLNDLSSGQYSVNKNIRFKTSILRSDLCEYSDAYTVVKGMISVTGTNSNNRRNKKPTFKNNASFISRISKINNAFIDNAKDLDIVMPMCNLLEYSNNYYMTSASLWNHYKD